MQINHIHVENYKTYLNLDLDISVKNEEKPIILIGGMNGSGKTTLFDAIYGALYGLKITDENHFRELFNSGVSNIVGKQIILEIDFEGMVTNAKTQYKLKRTYKVLNGKPVENVALFIGGSTYSYGTHTATREKTLNEMAVNKIIKANLPAELSNYFLFDAMKTSELVKDEQINNLIKDSIKSVMGFNKYSLLVDVAKKMLDNANAERLQNETAREEYKGLQETKRELESDLQTLRSEYDSVLTYATNHREQYDRLKNGKKEDDLTRDKIEKTEAKLKEIGKAERVFRQQAEELTKSLESDVIMQKVASLIKQEVESIRNYKDGIEEKRKNNLSDKQIDEFTRKVVDIIKNKYNVGGDIDVEAIINAIKYSRDTNDVKDKYDYLDDTDMTTLSAIIMPGGANPYLSLKQQKERTNYDMEDLPRLRERLEQLRMEINGEDYSFITKYDENEIKAVQLNEQIKQKEQEIKKVESKLGSYEFDSTDEPDPKYEMLKKMPEFFNRLQHKLLQERKSRMEEMMKELLNINLVSYSGTISRVDLSDKDGDISFKIYHKAGNEIPLNQLNAGAKQTVMQVLLKVLYELGDYEPPVMIDTVMGVLDKESRATIVEHYFPNLARQTILLSTDTEIRVEDDYKHLEAFISRAYTVKRDKERQCTEVINGYFGETIDE